MNREDLDLVLVMPAYNEEEGIADVVKQWIEVLRNVVGPSRFKMLVIDDGSKDRTFEVLKSLEQEIPELIVDTHPNMGHGPTIVKGYKKAIDMGANWVAQADSDNPIPPTEFVKLWNNRDKGDFIQGWRAGRQEHWFRKKIVTPGARFVSRYLFGSTLRDPNIPFRLMKAEVLQRYLEWLPEPVPFAPNVFLSAFAGREGRVYDNIPVENVFRPSKIWGKLELGKWSKLIWTNAKDSFRVRRHYKQMMEEKR
ncbi:MAG: glycosyltransferase family 2 protein [Chlorobi bacterium]|nr:glycosyltransferase family 2 protein [Chlorobiota bacterium]